MGSNSLLRVQQQHEPSNPQALKPQTSLKALKRGQQPQGSKAMNRGTGFLKPIGSDACVLHNILHDPGIVYIYVYTHILYINVYIDTLGILDIPLYNIYHKLYYMSV